MVPTASSTSSLTSVILTQDELKKIAAYKAVEYVESKMVLGLGAGSTVKHAKLQDLVVEVGCVAKLRTKGESGEPFETDNKNYIVNFDSILRIAGVVEHGMLLDVATTVKNKYQDIEAEDNFETGI
ncbi:hypothetical protein UlMin_025789 [Ulmus minor]